MSATMRKAITAGLHDVMTSHTDAIMLGEALDTRGGASEITYGFLQRYGGDRVIETPISENALVGMALGAAVSGLRVIAEVYSADFLVCAGSEVVNDIAKWRYQHQWKAPLHLVLRMPAGSSAKWAGPEHTQSIEAIFNNVPGLRIVVPSTPGAARKALIEAVEIGDPVIFLEHRSLYDLPEDEGALGEAASGNVLRGHIAVPGDDVTIVAWGAMQRVARDAARELADIGISAEVIDPVTVKPMNHHLIHESLAQTGRLVVVDEGPRTGGTAAEIIVRALEEAPCPLQGFRRVTFPDVHHPFDPRLEAALLPDRAKVVEAVKSIMDKAAQYN
ncbi:alpha-ketoacid dehydrogenase subunit beta [Microvirga zambiensis]|uniref:alpha-ketoacid dehydrogenase subunit beta n=1 Tax=Microvirga zambiensis TaxID=1402137 RepID=UPI00191D7D8E|nr:transketolase C-terminal domain-containing protein [Microvirga zambiensis]